VEALVCGVATAGLKIVVLKHSTAVFMGSSSTVVVVALAARSYLISVVLHETQMESLDK
jgi:hypothetical protein